MLILLYDIKEVIDDIGDYVSKVENDVLSITRSRNVGDFKAPGEVIEVIKEKYNGKGKG